ncbi:hypothetical protein CEY15_15590 [Dietzia natronolimnaea]|uniref:Uncharacterized protein n=1 Tax=Dietzia natronolimnaea TaxID=161920 RepID=A0A2A2WLF0_9ACTN|nr:hypothetical protein [Dietzia natronolimnaea]PAY22020.1 hypothetical protein CEY15_15590 [Dietzia natronolimnaea]
MLRPFFLTRVSIGVAASAVEYAAELPGRAVQAAVSLPTVPVKVAGNLVQTYLHAGQAVAELAVKGDRVIAAVFPARSDQPEWATFDEDLDTPGGSARYGTAASADGGAGVDGDDPDVPTGRVTPRST